MLYYQIGDEMLVGFLYVHDAATVGPMVRVKRGSKAWRAFERNWDELWHHASDWPDGKKRQPAPRGIEAARSGPPISSPEEHIGARLELRWDERELIRLLELSPDDAFIRIFVSFFVADGDLFAVIEELLAHSRRTVEIMMLDPDAPIIDIRYGTAGRRLRKGTLSADGARLEIKKQLGGLKSMHQRLEGASDDGSGGTLRVYVYDCAPTLISYQICDQVLIGMLLLHASANFGPMIYLKKDAKKENSLWNAIRDNWNAVMLSCAKLSIGPAVVGFPEDRTRALWPQEPE
jgi:hypothetical protein